MHEKMLDELKHIIAYELDVNINLEEITEDLSLLEEGIGLDSIAIMEFITLIEEHFSFKFDEEDLNGESFRNLRTLTHFIVTKLETQQQIGGTRR